MNVLMSKSHDIHYISKLVIAMFVPMCSLPNKFLLHSAIVKVNRPM